jgi:hypothetical protein
LSLANDPNVPACGSNQMFSCVSDPPIRCGNQWSNSPVDFLVLGGYPAILGEAACCLVEVAAIERLIELFSDAPIGLGNVQRSPPVAAWDSADLPCIPVGVQ